MAEKMNIPSSPATYAIIMQLAKSAEITVGKLGTFKFEPGYYTYIGTAFGPGELKTRQKL